MSVATSPAADPAAWLSDRPFLDGRAEEVLGAPVARREHLGRAQEIAHRLLERFCWGTDPSGRILLPGSRAAARWLENPPELAALAELSAGGPAAPLLERTRRALADPAPAAGPRRIATVLAAFHRDLAEAAGDQRGLVPAEFRPAGPADPAAYGTPPRQPVLDAGRHLAARPDLVSLALVHGSLATLDERPGVSDLDLLVVLAREAAEDPEGLLAARELALGLWPHLQRVDPLQHHGTFVLTPADLAFYPQVFLPLEVIRRARVLAGPTEGLPVVLRPTGLPRRVVLLRAAEMLRRPLPDSLFLAKLHLQVVLLAPCFLLQADGRFVYKRDAFAPFAEIAPPAAARAVEAASRARAEDQYAPGLGDLPALRERLAEEGLPPLLEAALLQRHLLRPLPPRLRELLSPEAAADRAALASLLEGAATPLPPDLADREFARDPATATARGAAPAIVTGSEGPAAIPGGDDPAAAWRETARRYVAALGADDAVLAAWGIGTPEPGSDLDLVLVVDPERAREVDWTRCAEAREALDPADREILEHPPSAVLPPSLARRAGLLSPLFRCTSLWGPAPDPSWWRVPSPDHALALLADYLLAMYPGEPARFERVLSTAAHRDEVAADPGGILRRLGAIRHTLALAEAAGVPVPGELSGVVAEARRLRARPGDDPPGRDDLLALLGRAVPALAELAIEVARGLRQRGWREAPTPVPAIHGLVGETIVLARGFAPAALAGAVRALEAESPGRLLTNVAPLPLAWGFLDALVRLPRTRDLFRADPERLVPPDLPPAPPAFRERWDAVVAHLEFLVEIRCPFAWFYPNHLQVDLQPIVLGGEER